MKKLLLAIPFLYLLACSSPQKAAEEQGSTETPTQEPATLQAKNPAMEGFNTDSSDVEAIMIADEVMKAMGGRKAWDNTRHIAWTFFGSRKLIWDKWTGNVRVESLKDPQVILLNINNNTGKVMMDGEELTEPDSVAKYVEKGRRAWINDSYWLVMPFKLKDSGVTLSYLGDSTTEDGRDAKLLELRFDGVGVTPQNKYCIWVDDETSLVSQWSFFSKAEDEEARFTMPWLDYKTYGKIRLSGDRGGRKLSDIYVFDELPESVYSSFETVDLSNVKPAI